MKIKILILSLIFILSFQFNPPADSIFKLSETSFNLMGSDFEKQNGYCGIIAAILIVGITGSLIFYANVPISGTIM